MVSGRECLFQRPCRRFRHPTAEQRPQLSMGGLLSGLKFVVIGTSTLASSEKLIIAEVIGIVGEVPNENRDGHL